MQHSYGEGDSRERKHATGVHCNTILTTFPTKFKAMLSAPLDHGIVVQSPAQHDLPEVARVLELWDFPQITQQEIYELVISSN